MVRVCITGSTIEQIQQYIPTIPALYGTKAQSATVEIVAGPTKPISGVIRAKDTGKPLPGVLVHGQDRSDGFVMLHDGVRVVTDENGRYRLLGLPKTDKYWLEIHPIEGQSYLPRMVEVAGNEGLKPIPANFDLERGVALRLRFVDTETGKPVLGQVEYYACFDNPRYEATRKDLGNHHRFWPNKDGVYNFVVVPGPGIIGFWAGLNGEKLYYLTVKLKPEDVKAHPGAEKRPIFFGGFVGVESFHAYRLIDAQPSDRPLTLDIPVYPKH